jgi:thiosulfate/3-mercaptopyruvate sulfurtransferase
MRRLHFKALLVVLLLLLLPLTALARDVGLIVSADWLEKNLKKVVVVDIRKVEDYKAGHIPKAVSVFYGSWAVKKGELRNELPAADDLFEVIGNAGINKRSTVVVVGKTDTPSDRVDITRVAWTLKYAGVDNVAVLDGGQNQWVKDGKEMSTDAVKVRAKTYKGKVNADMLASKDYVLGSIGKATILDVREPDFYAGKKKLPFVARLGHIKGALNLPTSGAYKADGTFKEKEELKALAAAAAGADKDKEIIVYCDTGKFATAWALILKCNFGYKDVKIYDGSSEEWMADPNAPIEP